MTNGTSGGSGDTRKIQLETVVDASAVKPGTEATKAAVREMSAAIEAEGKRAAAGVGAIGEAAEKSAEKADRATRNLVSQIQRVTAQTQTVASGGTQADYFERIARARGIDQAAIAPYLAQLREVEKAQRAVGTSTDATALSQRQLAFAMRGLPAQFTDIWTSLASGQAPLTVLLQQGGQIKDMFGGLLPAVRAIGQGLLALVNPWTVTLAAAAGVAVAFSKGAAEAARLRTVLTETGNASGLTAAQLQAMQTRMDAFGTTQAKANQALETFVRTGRTSAENLERFALAAIRLEAAGGPAVEKTAEAFAELGREPLRATLRLNEAMNYLSRSTLEQITALERAGRVTEAAALAQNAFFDAINEQTPEMMRNLGLIERGWIALKKEASEAWSALLNIGREQDPLSETVAQIAQLQARLANGFNFGLREGTAERTAAEQQLAMLQERLRVLQMVGSLDERAAALDRERANTVRALAEWNRQNDQFLTKRQRMEIEIAQARELGNRAGLTQLQIEERIAAIRAKFAERATGPTGTEDVQAAAKQWAEFYEQFARMAGSAEAETLKLTAAQAKLVEFLQSPAYAKMPETARQLVLELGYAAVAQEELTAQTKEYDKVLKSVQAGMDRAAEGYARGTEQITERTRRLQLETQQLGLTKEAQGRLAAAAREVEIQRLEALRNTDLYALASERDQRAIDERIRALKELAEAEREAGEKGALVDLQADWMRVAGQIEQSLTDALVRGFEKGRDFFKSIGDWIINYFKTTIARGIASALLGALGAGLSGFANASGLGGGLGGALGGLLGGGSGGGLGDLGSLAGLLGGGLSLGSWGGIGFLGGVSSTMTGAASLGGFSALLSGGSYSAALGMAAPYLAAAYGLFRLISGTGTGRSRGPAFQQWTSMTGGGGQFNPFAPFINNPAGGGDASQSYRAQLDAIINAVGAAAQGFGGSINPNTGFGLFTSTSPDNLGAQAVAQVFGAGGNLLFNANTNGANSDVMQRLMSAVPGMVLAGLQDANLPKAFADFFDKLDANGVTQEQLDGMLAIANAAHQMAEAFKQLGGPFQQLTDLSVEARAGILDMTGGLEQFVGKTNAYFQNFFSQEERQALSLASVEKTLSGAGIDTSGLRSTADFRALVESLDLSREDDRRKFAALMNSAEAFSFGADLLGATGLSLSQLTANAPATAGVDLMVTAQVTTNALLERIESAIREGSEMTVAAIVGAVTGVGPGTGGSAYEEVTTIFGGGN